MQITLNRFDEIEHTPLKVYNRVVFLNNLMEDSGRYAAESYIELFSDTERKQMYAMGSYIRQKGVDFVRKAVTKNLVIEEGTRD